MGDLTIPVGAGTVIGVLVGAIVKLWSNSHEKEKTHAKEIADLHEKYWKEIATLHDCHSKALEKANEETKREMKENAKNSELYLRVLAKLRSQSSIPPP